MSGFVGCDIHESYLHGCTLCKHNWRGTEAAVEKARADAAEAEVEREKAIADALTAEAGGLRATVRMLVAEALDAANAHTLSVEREKARADKAEAEVREMWKCKSFGGVMKLAAQRDIAEAQRDALLKALREIAEKWPEQRSASAEDIAAAALAGEKP